MTKTLKQPKTFMLRKEDVNRQWILLDASGKTLGRLSTEIATILRGKHKPTYTPHTDCGDGVIVVNAEKIEVTGLKADQKVYRRYTGHVGGLRTTTYQDMMERKPTFILEHAVRGMLPRKTRLARAQLRRLRIFAGDQHGMEAQQPIKVEI